MCVAALFLLLALTACAASPPAASPQLAAAEPPPYQCILPTEQRMLVAEFFFGRDKAGRKVVSDAEWSDFLASVVTLNFPDGLTVFDGYGQWRNPETGIIGRSPSVKIVLIAAKRGPDLPARITATIDAYKARFQQQSVGLITRDSCAAF